MMFLKPAAGAFRLEAQSAQIARGNSGVRRFGGTGHEFGDPFRRLAIGEFGPAALARTVAGAQRFAAAGKELEVNRSIRRPEDIVRALGISPIATLPYIQSRKEVIVRRSRKLVLALAILVGASAMIYAVHIYYQPLDVIAERIMNKMGMRW